MNNFEIGDNVTGDNFIFGTIIDKNKNAYAVQLLDNNVVWQYWWKLDKIYIKCPDYLKNSHLK